MLFDKINILLVITASLNFLLGLFVFLGGKTRRVNITYTLNILAIIGWIVAMIMFRSASLETSLFWCLVLYIIPTIIASSFLIFTYVFPSITDKNITWKIALILALNAAMAAAVAWPGLIIKEIDIRPGYEKAIIFAPYYWAYFIYIISLFSFGFIRLYRKYLRSTGMAKAQILYLFFGYALAANMAFTTNLLLPWLGVFSFNWLGQMMTVVMVGFTAYAILRYHLMDIWVVLRLGTIFAVLFAAISFVYVFLSEIIGRFFSAPWSFIIPSLVITLGFIPLKNFVELITDKIFFRRSYKLSDIIHEIDRSIISSGLNLNEILSSFDEVVTKALRVKKSAFLILAPGDSFIFRRVVGNDEGPINLTHDSNLIRYLVVHKGQIADIEELRARLIRGRLVYNETEQTVSELEKIGFSVAVPINLRGNLIGIYLLGPKLSGDPLTKGDINLLSHIGGEAGVAIDNARMYEELKKLDESKSEFVSVASHQLRTPLSIVRWNLELAMDKNLNSDERGSLLDTAYGGVLSLGHQLDQLMTVLDIEEGKVIANKKRENLNHIVSYLLKERETSHKIEVKNINFVFEPNNNLPEVNCDTQKIHKVVSVLVDNAITYTADGGVIEAKLVSKKDDKKTYLVFSISDSGIGIADYDQQHIFKKLFRSNEAIVVSPNGFGLGLFIAQKYINAHGGEIGFQLNEDKGTTFYFTLPIE